MERPKPEYKTQYEIKRRRRIFRAVMRASVVCLCLLVLLVLYTIFPYRTYLPAYEIGKREEGEFRIHFVDVGQGDATILEFPSGEVLVADAGDGSWAVRTKLIRYIKGLNASSFNMLLTHPDADHFGGAKELLRTFPFEKVYLPTFSDNETVSEEFDKTLAVAEQTGAEAVHISRYSLLSEGSVFVGCLSPYSVETGDENDASALLYAEYAGVRIVLSGDVSAKREQQLCDEYAADNTLFTMGGKTVDLENIDLLKVAHHGSSTSSGAEWVRLLSAKYCVISCGRGNSYGHPSLQTIARLKAADKDAEIYRTDELGDLVFSVKADGSQKMTIRSEL